MKNKSRKREDDAEVLTFKVFLAGAMQRSSATIEHNLFGARRAQVQEGYGDPPLGKSRLWLALQEFEWFEEAFAQQFPVTREMLEWIWSDLDIYRKVDDATRWAESTAPPHREWAKARKSRYRSKMSRALAVSPAETCPLAWRPCVAHVA